MPKKKFIINLKGWKFVIKEYIECKNFFQKARGLMFRGKNFKIPLLFVFPKPGNYTIHSFFCRKFLAIWLLKNKVIEMKIVKPWRLFVVPKEKFDILIEIPLGKF